jgi:O-antigen ligase
MRALVNVALRQEPAIIRTLFFLAPFVTLLAPKTTVVALILLSLCCVGLALAHGERLKSLFPLDITLGLFGGAALYLFINAAWSLDPGRAVGKAIWFTLVVVMAYGAWHALSVWREEQIRRAVTAFFIGLAVGLAIILFEVATRRFLTISLYNLLPFTRPESTKAMIIKHGDVIKIAAFELNRNVNVLLLMLWPALLCLTERRDARTGLVYVAGLALAVVATVILSRHETSKLGIVLSAIVFAVALAWPVFARRALLAGWCLAFLLVVPLATLAYKAELHESDWIRQSAQARLILWAYTAEQIPKAPILGIGTSSTRTMNLENEPGLKAEEHEKGEAFGWRAGPHAHNSFLQTWYELGAVGVILFLMAGSAVILGVGKLPRRTQPYVLAHLAAVIATLAFAWGLWQSWLMAVMGLAALYAGLAVNFARAEGPYAQPAKSL